MCAAIPCAYGQSEDDTSSVDLSRAGKNALADGYFFDAMKAKMHDDDKLAKELLLKYISLRSDVPAAFYELSRISYGARNNEKAEEYIKKAIELSPGNKWYLEEYAAILADRDAYPEAAKVMAELVEKNPQDANYAIIAAEYFNKAKKHNEAITYLDKALVIHNNEESILMRKIEVYLALNDVEKAASVVRQMIANEPRNGKYYKLLGDIYSDNQQHQKAADVYREAEKIIPGDPAIQLGIAESYLKAKDTAAFVAQVRKVIVNKEIEIEGQLEIFRAYMQTLPNDSVMGAQALPIIRELVTQHPDDDQVLFIYGDLLDFHKQHDSAMAAYKAALRIKPNNPLLWSKVLSGYTDNQYADSLIKTSERAMRLFPNVAIYSYFNSIGYMNKKQYPQAINAVKRAIDMQPENDTPILASMYSLLADQYHLSKQDDLSDKTFDKVLKLDPNNAAVLNNYAYYLSERGKRLEEAEKMSQKSLDGRPEVPTYLDTYGWIQYKKGNYLKAKDFIERAIRLSGASADAALYDHLGDICYQLNDKVKALEYWRKAKEAGSDDPLIDKKISDGKLYE